MIRPIAIHLPQYHPIPENDEWWGKGFTEWTNVSKAKPLFKNHYQPHLPADLGFYDLRLEEARLAQETLARQNGIYGFCYYHYWFNGKRLLNEPVDRKLKNPKEEFPFMICWANENWSRRWDGSENEILMAQNYSKEDAVEHTKTLLKYFLDSRYIKVDHRPVFVVYKPHLIPNLEEYIAVIRAEAYIAEKIELYICAFDTGTPYDTHQVKLFDAIIEFQPQSPYLWEFMEKKLRDKVDKKVIKLYEFILRKAGKGTLVDAQHQAIKYRLDYVAYVDYVMKTYRFPKEYNLFPCINPMWDNTARRGKNSFLFYNESVEKYGEWLSFHLKNYNYRSDGSNFLFINAWNEWAEGNHLEPCRKWGSQYLEITQKKLLEASKTQLIS